MLKHIRLSLIELKLHQNLLIQKNHKLMNSHIKVILKIKHLGQNILNQLQMILIDLY